MTENSSEEVQHTVPSPEERTNRVTIATIIAVVIIVLACLAACTAVTIVFLMNAPWRVSGF